MANVVGTKVEEQRDSRSFGSDRRTEKSLQGLAVFPPAGQRMKDKVPMTSKTVQLQRRVKTLEIRLGHVMSAYDRARQEIQRRETLEKCLREKTEALARSNRDLERFASIAAHDLQEPLHSILVFLDLLQIKYGNRLGETGIGYVSRVQQSANRMKKLIQGLLSYSKIVAPPSSNDPVSLRGLIEAILSDINGKIQETGAMVQVGDLPTIPGHSPHLRQLFHHLILNALKFHATGHPPVVTITGYLMPDRRHRGQGKSDRLCRVDIQDQGIGIPEDQQEKIFGIFNRLHRHDEFDGAGIGLAVCQRIVEQYGGGISVKSSTGKGSTFTVILPVNSEATGP